MALYARDALAKAVYDRLFSWLIQRLNNSLEPEDKEEKYSALGILDIYGFEIFEKNRWDIVSLAKVNLTPIRLDLSVE